MPRTRLRREVNALPQGCEIPGSNYGVTEVPHCHVTNAEYNAELDLCLSEVIPGKFIRICIFHNIMAFTPKIPAGYLIKNSTKVSLMMVF